VTTPNGNGDAMAALFRDYPLTADLLDGHRTRALIEQTPERLRLRWVGLMRELIETFTAEAEVAIAKRQQVTFHDAIMRKP